MNSFVLIVSGNGSYKTDIIIKLKDSRQFYNGIYVVGYRFDICGTVHMPLYCLRVLGLLRKCTLTDSELNLKITGKISLNK